MSARTLSAVIRSVATSDGAGVRLRRSLGQRQDLRLDPFLMLDEFGTDNPDDYIAGFPAHPHRGFETVTYMIDGHMRHEDHLGNTGDLKTGGVQWMTAGRGIIHSEMPQQTSGRMRGFQLWINLPAAEKMKPAGYRDIQPEQIPCAELPGGGRVKVIAGTVEVGAKAISGPIAGLSTEPLFLDLELPADAEFEQALPAGHNAFCYPYEGRVEVGPEGRRSSVPKQAAGVFARDGEGVAVRAAEAARLVLLAGRPIGEPVAQYGPFVMNTPAELEQALRDYRSGRLTASG